ncbi:MAG: anthranilate phosphoribosyltransferase [Planctomycetota bacterium]
MIQNLLEKLFNRQDLTRDEAHGLMNAVMEGRLVDAQIAAVLIALRMKGETVEEIAGFARAMREKAVCIAPGRPGTIDTCGTGGDAKNTFNISTATAILSAAMGIPVAKHGNRAVSSQCGSADVLEALGVKIGLEPGAVCELIRDVGIGFLFAPSHHPAMKHAAATRKQLGVRTVFNVLGPLTNPAGVERQLLGVYDAVLTEKLCLVLRALGSKKAFVVHGMDGMDEVSITGETRVSALDHGEVRTFCFSPEEAGLKRARLDEISGSSAGENAAHIRNLLLGRPGPRQDAVLLNAGFAAMLADRAGDVSEGVALAREAIASGKAGELLDRLCRVSHAKAG